MVKRIVGSEMERRRRKTSLRSSLGKGEREGVDSSPRPTSMERNRSSSGAWNHGNFIRSYQYSPGPAPEAAKEELWVTWPPLPLVVLLDQLVSRTGGQARLMPHTETPSAKFQSYDLFEGEPLTLLPSEYRTEFPTLGHACLEKRRRSKGLNHATLTAR